MSHNTPRCVVATLTSYWCLVPNSLWNVTIQIECSQPLMKNRRYFLKLSHYHFRPYPFNPLFSQRWLTIQRICSLCHGFDPRSGDEISEYTSFSLLSPRLTSLRMSIFLFMAFTSSFSKLTSSVQARSWCVSVSFYIGKYYWSNQGRLNG
jgi:hypothetical protein